MRKYGQIVKPLYDLPKITQFTENLSAKIYGLELTDEYIERKREEEPLSESEERLRILFELAPDGICILNLKGYIIQVNKAFTELTGFTKDELKGKHFLNCGILRPKDFLKNLKLVSAIVKGQVKNPIEFYWHHKDRSKRIGETHVSVIKLGRFKREIISIARDITERRRMEDAVKESEEKYRELVENVVDVIYSLDTTGNIVSVNKAIKTMFGFKPEEVIGKNVLEFIEKEARLQAIEDFKQIRIGKKITAETTMIDKYGNPHIVEFNSTVIIRDGEIVGSQGIVRDITERKRMEDRLSALHSSAIKLSSAKNFNDVTDVTLEIVKRVLGFDNGGIAVVDGDAVCYISSIGIDIPKASIPLDSPSITIRAVKTGRSQLVPDTRLDPDYLTLVPENVNLSELAVPVILDSQVEAVINLENQRVNAFTEDDQRLVETLAMHVASALRRLREVERLEELIAEKTRELKYAERMAAIGEMAAMVGHDLRNPLQAITNAVYVLKKERERGSSILSDFRETIDSLPEPLQVQLLKPLQVQIIQNVKEIFEQHVSMIRIIDESVKYANKIVSDLQDYARPIRPNLLKTDLDQLFNDTLSTIIVPENVNISTVIERDFKLIVDPALMKRVFTNMIVNALQAMPDGGWLTIRASKTKEAAHISIEDTGIGIPEENMPKLFQPLFTTKAKGTGFGLAVCKRLVEAHKGIIMVESQVNKGSTFTIILPIKER